MRSSKDAIKLRDRDLFRWIEERYNIHQQRAAGYAKPWTKNPILQQYRFCNVYREDDAVTQWIAKHWRTPHQTDDYLWFAMVVARLFNLPNTLAKLGYPVPYNPRGIYRVTEAAQRAGCRVFNGAYIVSTNGNKMDKVQYLVQRVLTPLWEQRKNVLRAIEHATLLAEVHQALMAFDGLGSFMAAQVVADLKYTPSYSHSVFPDWDTFAASGPGGRRGLNRVCGLPVEASWPEHQWHSMLMELKFAIDKLIKAKHMPPLHAQDLQNCLCEFDKYERCRLGEGRPKQKYAGGA